MIYAPTGLINFDITGWWISNTKLSVKHRNYCMIEQNYISFTVCTHKQITKYMTKQSLVGKGK